MAHSKSALKRWRQNEKARARNKPVRTGARTAARKARASIDAGSDDAAAAIKEAMSILDRAAKHNVIHKNAASRQKSRLMTRLNKAAAAPAAAEAPKKARRATTTKAKAPAKPRAKKST